MNELFVNFVNVRSRSGFKAAVYVLIMVMCFSSNLFSKDKVLSFGAEINPVRQPIIKIESQTIPEKGHVVVLFFFNIESYSHKKILFELNGIYLDLFKSYSQLEFIGISKGDNEAFFTTAQRFDLKYPLINDFDGTFLDAYDYKCGSCTKVIIIDKKGILRYNAEHVDFYFIKSIVERYAKEKE